MLQNPSVYKGFGREIVLSFTFGGFKYSDGSTDTQKKIDNGEYKSIEDFDSYHTADIEFEDLYAGDEIERYREATKNNLITIGKFWRNKIERDYPDADITIIIHQNDGEWFLDTFNYSNSITGGIYL